MTLAPANGEPVIEQVDADHVRVRWCSRHTLTEFEATYTLAELAALQRGEVPPGVAQPEIRTLSDQMAAAKTRRSDLLHALRELTEDDENWEYD